MLDFFNPYLLKKGCRVILGHTNSENTVEHQLGGEGSPDFPEVGAGSFVQCGALVLTFAAHVVQVDIPLVEHLSNSESPSQTWVKQGASRHPIDVDDRVVSMWDSRPHMLFSESNALRAWVTKQSHQAVKL